MCPRRSSSPDSLPTPFLKWVGGKGQLLPELLTRLPTEFRDYHEPFLGGGALFFALFRKGLLRGRRVRLSDSNEELVRTYQAIQDNVVAVIESLQQFHYDRDQFYEVRAWDWRTLEPPLAAARMIYLNRTGFNGLYRVNSKGGFNVPFGRYKNPRICDAPNLRAVSQALRSVDLSIAPFEKASRRVKKDDLVYFDPPYEPLSRTSSFVAYARQGFGREDQERLAGVFEALAEKGAKVVLSNSGAAWVQDRYSAFTLLEVWASRLVNARSESRGPVAEVIVTSYPVEEV
jgi:DNA adenine methylase